jgi:M6 family metalloprotease-like protein
MRFNLCRTKSVTLGFLANKGVRFSPIKRQAGRNYPRGTIGTGLLPIAPLRGRTIRVCHILVNFPRDADRLSLHTPAFYDDILFNEGNPESMASYYKEVSYGQTRITGKTFGWFNFGATANNPLGLPRAAVAAEIAGSGLPTFVPQLVQQADAAIDFSQFDGDGDGRVDALIITFPQTTGYYSLVYGNPPIDPFAVDPLSATAYRFSAAEVRALGGAQPPVQTNDAVVVDQWVVMGEGFSGLTMGFNNGVAVYAHEFGHILGLPDTIDEQFALLPRLALGSAMWDGMAIGNRNDPTGLNINYRPQMQGGIVHHMAWCKFALGWVTPVPVTSRQAQVTIPAVETNPVVYRLSVNGDPLNPEYFLIENRQNIGRFDSLLRGTTLVPPAPLTAAPGTGPGQRLAHGLLVWHIDESVIENSSAGFFIVSDINHPGIKLMQADGRNDLDNLSILNLIGAPWNLVNFGFAGIANQGNFGDDSDPFPGVNRITEFTFATNPSSQTYNGFDSGVRIENISEQRSNVVADLDVTPVFAPTLTVAEPTEGQRTANTTPTIHAIYSNGSALGNAADPLLVSSIDILLDNQPVVTDGQVDPQAGTFTFDGTNVIFRPTVPLTAGRHTVLIRGNDQSHANTAPPFVNSALINFTIQPLLLAQSGGVVQMVSFPFRLTVTPGLQPNNAAQLAVIQDLTFAGPQFVLQSPNPNMARFDRSINNYHFFNPVPPPGARPTDPFVDLIFPGCAYWVLVPANGIPLRIEGSAVASNQIFQIIHEDSAADGTLPAGFRMIGNPFDFPVDWASVQVGFQGQRLSLQQAIDSNLVSPVIYTFTPQGYRFSVAPDGQLTPFAGHWINLIQPVQLFIPPARSGLRSPVNAQKSTRNAPSGVQWRLQLTASVGESSDAYNYVGAATTAEDGQERWDVPEAPDAPNSRVTLNIVPDDNPSAKLAQDLRKGPLTSKQIFNLEVVASAPNSDVRIGWENVQDVPNKYSVILRDPETQKQVYLRTSSGYTFNTGANTVRRLQVIVDPQGGKPLRVAVRASKAQAGIGALFIYSLSQEADVEATILSPTGQIVRRFNVRSSRAGIHTLNWDSKDSRGRTLGHGVYLLRVRAQTVDQQLSQGVATFTMR